MRYGFRVGFAFALGLALMAGCSEDGGGGSGGSGGTAGTGGEGGTGGIACTDNVCPCTEAGIRAAIAEGGGRFTFDCVGPTTIVLEEKLVVDKDIKLDGEGKLTLDGRRAHPVFLINRLWVSEGSQVPVTAELKGFTVTNVNKHPGGIENHGALTVTSSTISDHAGSGIFSVDGTLTVNNSTLTRNSDCGILTYQGELTVVNSTVTRNTCGIFSYSEPATVLSTTISENTGTKCYSGTSGGGICYGGGVSGPVTLTNTIISGNGDGVQSLDCSGIRSSAGYNIESPGNTCGFDEAKGDLFDVTAEQLALGPLQDNGGPTHTHALLPDSVAVDAIPQEECLDAEGNPLTTDQRGEPRPAGPNLNRCDAGSFELVCFGSACTGLCADAATRCEDLNPCTDDICDPFTGTCSNVNDDGNSCDTCSGVNGGCVCRGGTCVDCTLPEPATGQVVRNACRNSFNDVVSEFSVIMDVALNQCALEGEPFSADVTAALFLDTTFLQLAADVLCDLGIPLTEVTVLGAQVEIDSVTGAECGRELSVLSPVPQDVALDVTVTGVCGAGGRVAVNSGVTVPLDPVMLSCTAGAVEETVAICSVGVTPRYLYPNDPRTVTWMEVSVPGIPDVVVFGCGGPATTNPAPGEEVGCDALNLEWEFPEIPCSSRVGAGTFGEMPFPISDCQLTAPPAEPIDCGDVECPGTCETVPIALPWSECATFPVDR